MWLDSVYEGFIITFATCGVFFRGLIYLLELRSVLLDQGMQILRLEVVVVAAGRWVSRSGVENRKLPKSLMIEKALLSGL